MRSSPHKPPKRRKRDEYTRFTQAKAHLHAGVIPTQVVLAEVFGDCKRGKEWRADFSRLLRHMRLSEARTRRDGSPYAGFDANPIHGVDDVPAREVALRTIDLFSLMERQDDGSIGIVGARGWWGKQHRKVRLTQEERDHRMYDREMRLEAVGAPLSLATPVREIERTHVGKEGTRGKGLAGRWECCVSSVARTASILKAGRFIGSTQPPAAAADAVMPKRPAVDENYPYTKWRILRSLPARVLRTLRAMWNELTEEPEPIEAPTPAPPEELAAAPACATGPPAHVEPPAPRLPNTETGRKNRDKFLQNAPA